MDRLKIIDTLPQPVNLNQIDDSPGPCRMSYGFDTKPLADSIHRIGLINSPILIGKGEGGGKIEFVVVAGFRRIKALEALGETHAPCRILPPETSFRKCLLINLYENLAIRGFNPVEKGMALARLLEWIPEKEVVKTFMPLFDLPSNEKVLHLFVRIETEFARQAKDLLAGGDLSTKAAKLLLEMDSADREKFCHYFSIIKFTKNQQTHFIDFIDDLSHIEGRAIARLLDDPELADICHNEQMNNPQKARALIAFLRTRRLPHLVKAEKRFRRMVEKLSLPESYRITPPPFFEGPNYRLEISFKNGKDLMEKVMILVHKEGLVTLKDPWDKRV